MRGSMRASVSAQTAGRFPGEGRTRHRAHNRPRETRPDRAWSPARVICRHWVSSFFLLKCGGSLWVLPVPAELAPGCPPLPLLDLSPIRLHVG